MIFKDVNNNDIEWKRPHEIANIVSETSEKPAFVKCGFSRFDIEQGSQLNDCWALTVMANLASTSKRLPNIFGKICNPTQSFDNDNHHFTFKFFERGKWCEVKVDDYLPWNTRKQKLLFVSSTDKLEFWPCLLEKAYAKFKGSYADLNFGMISCALHDMTGYEWKNIDTEETDQMYYDICDKISSIGLVFAACLGTKEHNVRDIGLISSHAYSITGFGGDVNHGKCLRLLNPWGHYEYTGSESHVLNDVDDGEFVIKWTEFCKYFPYFTVPKLDKLNS